MERFRIRDAAGDWTDARLQERARRIAQGLQARGDSLRGERIALLAQPGADFVAAQQAIWKVGGVLVPLCLAHPVPEWQYTLQNSGARYLVHGAEFSSQVGFESQAQPLSIPQLESAEAVAHSPVELGAYDGALMLYTSGTTGRPKGALITHGQLRSQIDTLREAWGWSAEDRTLHVLPLHHTHGLINVLGCGLASGASLEMSARFDPIHCWGRLSSGELTLFMAVPTIYTRLIQAWEAADPSTRDRWSAGVRGLRLMVSGSAALPVSVFETWERISGHRLLERYGMTEIGMAISNPLHGERRPGTVGRPLPRVRVRRVDELGQELLDPSHPGELWVAGPSVFKEYWAKPDATRDAFVVDAEGVRWFKTGDVGVIEDGYFRLLGRTSVDILKSGGYKISALEIEERLRECPQVRDCAVVGKADEEWGERVACAVVLAPGAGLEEVQSFARQGLAKYKVPSLWRVCSELPRNAMGKVMKPEVKKLFDLA